MNITTLPTLPSLHSKVSSIPTLSEFAQATGKVQPNKIGAVPISQSKISQVSNVIVKPVSLEENDQEDEVMADEYALSKFVELKKFIPKTLGEQLNEFSLSGFKDVSNESLEQILNELLNVEFEWSCIEEVDLKIIIVRLLGQSLQNCQTISKILKLDQCEVSNMKLKVTVENNTLNFMKETIETEEDFDPSEMLAKIGKILEKSKNEAKTTTDLDYVIDENELKGIPLDVLPQLKKDIKEFRLKALENEKKKREKEVIEEKKRAKLQLRKLFEKFRNETTGQVQEDDEDEDEDEEENDDDMTDEQYEEMTIKKEQQEMLQRFSRKLETVLEQENKNSQLLKDLSELKNYQSQLDKTIKPGYETGHFKSSGRDKLKEFEADDKNRQEHQRDIETKKQSDEFLASINIPLKLNISNEDTLLIEDDKLDQILHDIKPKINSYIEEFMGVEDEELCDYISAIVKDEKSKTKLETELEEPLGDDSKALADKLWADIKALI